MERGVHRGDTCILLPRESVTTIWRCLGTPRILGPSWRRRRSPEMWSQDTDNCNEQPHLLVVPRVVLVEGREVELQLGVEEHLKGGRAASNVPPWVGASNITVPRRRERHIGKTNSNPTRSHLIGASESNRPQQQGRTSPILSSNRRCTNEDLKPKDPPRAGLVEEVELQLEQSKT